MIADLDPEGQSPLTLRLKCLGYKAGKANVEVQGFSIVDRQPLQFKTGLINNEQINNLLVMTPHFYRASKEGREAAGNLGKLELTVDIIFRTLEKRR